MNTQTFGSRFDFIFLYSWILPSALFLFSISACTTKTSNVLDANEIRIGEVDSMTGNEASFGLDTQKGIQLALNEINASGGIAGKRLRLISADAQGRADEGARALARLITQDKVIGIITGATSSNALAMAPLAQKYQIPLLATGATNPKFTQVGDTIFRICFLDSVQGKQMATFVSQKLKLSRIAILRDIRSDYSMGLADIFSQSLAKTSQIVVDQSYSGGDIDFSSQLTSIRSQNPDAIYIPGYYTDVSMIARQARSLGLTVPLLGGDGWDSPKLSEIGGSAIHGSYFSNFYASSDPSPSTQNFIKKFIKHYGVEPNGSSAMGYEGAQVMIDALKRSKAQGSLQLKQALASTKDLPSLHGLLSLDENRNAIKSVVILKVTPDGKTHFFDRLDSKP